MMDQNLCRFSKFHQKFKDLKDEAQGSMPNQATIKPTTPATVLPAMATSPEKYNDELDTLLSCLESKIPPDLCLMSTPRTSALHATFPGDIDGRDPKSQREIDQLPPEEAKRYNDATRAEFNGMKKKQVMELVPASSIPPATQILRETSLA